MNFLLRFMVFWLILNFAGHDSRAQNYKKFVQESWRLSKQGNFQASANQLEKALEGARAKDEKELQKQGSAEKDYYSLSTLYNDLGVYHGHLSHYSISKDYFLKSIEAASRYHGGANKIQLMNIAVVFENEGEFLKAENHLLQAYEMGMAEMDLESNNYVRSGFYAASSLASFYRRQGHLERALDVLEPFESYLSQSRGKNSFLYSKFLKEKALILSMSSKKQALELLDQSLSINRQKMLAGIEVEDDQYPEETFYNTLSDYVSMKLSIGEWDGLQDKIDSAISYFDKAYGEESLAKIRALNQKGKLAIASGDSAEMYQIVEHISNFLSGREEFLENKKVDILSSCADFYWHFNDPLADSLFITSNNSALKTIAERFNYFNEKERRLFYDKTTMYFNIFYNYLLTAHQRNQMLLGEALNLRLETKGLLLNTTIKIKEQLKYSKDTVLNDLFLDWVTLKNKMNSKEKYQRYQAEADSIERILVRRVAAFSDLSERKIYGWEIIRDSLEKDEVFIEVIRTPRYAQKFTPIGPNGISIKGFLPETYYMYLIVKPESESPELVLAMNGNAMDSIFFNQYSNAINFKVKDELSFGNYWLHLEEHLKGVNKIHLSPDGVYNKINVNTLLDPKTGKFLLEKYDIRIVLNGKDVLRKPQHNSVNSTDKVVLFGRPKFRMVPETQEFDRSAKLSSKRFSFSDLPGTQLEVIEISNILSQSKVDSKIFLDVHANESNLKSLVDPSILHIATHGYFQYLPFQDPLFYSGIALSGASDKIQNVTKEDGLLSAYEATGLSLDQTELVVLSACETGMGLASDGQGIYGLQSALKIAGAELLIMSLWKVDDQVTQELMTTFYRILLDTDVSFQEAFRKAQYQVKQNHSDPYFWGAFHLIGTG